MKNFQTPHCIYFSQASFINSPPQAEEFQEVVTVMREFLPQAEAQLKFRALPEDEMVILQLIEKHEVCHQMWPSCSLIDSILAFVALAGFLGEKVLKLA